jgi:23S rRNA (adenine2503-C2)-methyltransferase
MTSAKKDIRSLTLEEIQTLCLSLGQPKFRAGQLYDWLWKRSALRFEDMTNLSKEFRNQLEEAYAFYPLTLDLLQKSQDGTLKSRWLTHDGHKLESVLIPVPHQQRYTVCVSSQIGCSLTCSFCATGRMGLTRQLTAAEIYDQVVGVQKQSLETFGHPLTNVVYMGMGEPLLNYKQVMRSVALLGPEGLGMSPKRLTISTAGIAKMIKKMAEEGTKVNLALSLHAADDLKRNEIMPINESNNLEALMEALEAFYQATGNRISYEYIAFDQFNDHPDDAHRLSLLCKRFPVRVNIIEYNPIGLGTLVKSGEDRLNRFAETLVKKGVTVTVRRSRGKDIDAACGQLANK